MTEQERFTIEKDFNEHHRQIRDNGKVIMGCFVKPQAEAIVKLLNELNKEKEELKKELLDCKKDEKQLSISFMEFKMQLIEVLQQNYNYAYNQRQKNLDKSIIARNYEVLYQTIDNIAETMNVDIERFPKR